MKLINRGPLQTALIGVLLVTFARAVEARPVSRGVGTPPALRLSASQSAWSVVDSPTLKSSVSGLYDSFLYGVSGDADNDVWAVGSSCCYGANGDATQTLIEHWNGKKWKIVKSAKGEPANASFRSVAAIASNDAWAVGYATQPLIERCLPFHFRPAPCRQTKTALPSCRTRTTHEPFARSRSR